MVSLSLSLTAGEEREDSPPAVAWDFGLHPSDAGKVCKREMEGGGGGGLVNTSHPWHPGRLLFYNRAELKQSDHRPVVALIEVPQCSYMYTVYVYIHNVKVTREIKVTMERCV